jgi:uncharacterized protein (TIGR00369 family)
LTSPELLPAALDETLAARIRASFAAQAAMKTLGARIEMLAPGRLVLAMAHAPHLTQQHGFLHAGMLAAALDSACGYAAATLAPPDAEVLTIEYKINLLAPARGPQFRIEGRVVKAGRTVSVVDGSAWQHAGDPAAPPALVATMTASIIPILGRRLG